MPRFQADEILFGKYKIVRFLGTGAFAEVYQVEHLLLQNPRAIKVLSHSQPGVGSTDYGRARLRFKLEATLGDKLEHPNLIRVYDFEEQDETLVLVMEYAPGGNLKERLFKTVRSGNLLPVEECIQIARQVAAGLGALHVQQIVHRDVKPSNILFSKNGEAKLSDYGLVQVADDLSMRSLDGSQAKSQPGTPLYMSPEQEIDKSMLTPASDVFSLGVTLFEMLTGKNYKLLEPGTRASELREDIPGWLDDLLDKMLQENYRQRPWDGSKVERQLAEGMAQETAVRERLAAEEKERQDKQEQAKRVAEELAQRVAAEKARMEAEEQARLQAEEQAQRDTEEKARLEAEEKTRQEAEALALLTAQELSKQEAEDKARQDADEKARLEAEARLKREAEEKARLEAVRQAQQQAMEKAKREADEKARRDAQDSWLRQQNIKLGGYFGSENWPGMEAALVELEHSAPQEQTRWQDWRAKLQAGKQAAVARWQAQQVVRLEKAIRQKHWPEAEQLLAELENKVPAPTRWGEYRVQIEKGKTSPPPGKGKKFRWIIVAILGLIVVCLLLLSYCNLGNNNVRKNVVMQATREPDRMVEVYVPAGAFLMGSTESDANGQSDEKPQHSVTLDAYWIDKFEVTNAQYALCKAAGKCSEPSSGGSYTHSSYYGNSDYNDYPVIYVSWQQASDYCNWAGGNLPTEAQWEKAARGTDGRIYPWGSQAPDGYLANFNNNVGDTTRVGSYPGGDSPYGALDMAGNVWEWVADYYGSYSATSQLNPTGPTSGASRVVRGGSWYYDLRFIRTAYRNGYNPAYQLNYVGFRCSR